MGKRDELLGLGQRAGQGFFNQGGIPVGKKGPGDLAVEEGGNGDRDGVDPVEELMIVADGAGAEAVGDRLGLLGPAIGHGHQFHIGQRGQDSCVMLAQMANAHNAHAQSFHRSGSPSFAAPSVLALLLALEEIEQLAHLGAEMAVRSRGFRWRG